MKNNIFKNLIVNYFSLITLIISFFSGIFLWLFIPRGEHFLFLTRSDWNNIHLVFSLIFGFLMVVHLLLHMIWIKNSFNLVMKGGVNK